MKIPSVIVLILCSLWGLLAGGVVVSAADPLSPSSEVGQQNSNFHDSSYNGFNPPLQMRRASLNNMPTVGHGLESRSYARNLGQIGGMAVGANGEIYVLDQEKQHVIQLVDQDMDARIDMTKPLATGFHGAENLLYHAAYLYVADREAIWKIDINKRVKSEFVSLKNIGQGATLGPMIMHQSMDAIILVLNLLSDEARIIAVHMASGEANILAQGHGHISSLSMLKETPLWATSGNKVFPVMNGRFNDSHGRVFKDGYPIKNLYLLPADALLPDGFEALAGQYVFIRGQEYWHKDVHDSGMNVVSVESFHGQPKGDTVSFIDGFVLKHGRSAWGQPAHLVWDERGLFLSDTYNGSIWHIAKSEPQPQHQSESESVTGTRNETKLYESGKVEKPKANWGSSIGQASSIVHGSTLEGSTIVDNFEKHRLIQSGTLMDKLRVEEQASEADE